MGLKKAYEELEITNGPLELNGNDIRDVNSIDASSVSTGELNNTYIADPTDSAQTNINNANNAGQSKVYFPAGTYEAKSDISVPNEMTLTGANKWTAIWNMGGDIRDIIGDNISIQHLRFNFNSGGHAELRGVEMTVDSCVFWNPTTDSNFACVVNGDKSVVRGSYIKTDGGTRALEIDGTINCSLLGNFVDGSINQTGDTDSIINNNQTGVNL